MKASATNNYRVSSTRTTKKHDKTQPLEDDKTHLTGAYTCIGLFHTDFLELCRRSDMATIPAVVLRAKPPCEIKSERVKDKGKVSSHIEHDLEPTEEDGEQVEAPPKTYIMKDSAEYFKPSIQVHMDHPDKQETVTEVYIRGWKIDNTMMNILKQCWSLLTRLTTINLWHAGLTGETVSTLASVLPLCLHLKNLTLDGNWMKDENWHELIADNSPVLNLSLRNCFITDKGAEGLGQALGTCSRVNTKLLQLNLSGNRITDVGCEHIANGLRMNRTLLTLSLASNKIGDRGCCKLAEVLHRFSLTHDEVVERRKLLSEKEQTVKPKTIAPIRSRKSSFDKKREKGIGKVKKEKSDEDRKSKKEDKSKRESRNKDSSSYNLLSKNSKMFKTPSALSLASELGKQLTVAKERKREKRTQSAQEMPEMPNLRVLEGASYIDGELWVTGNRVVISLNLSRNQIGIEGIQAWIKTMQGQTASEVENKESLPKGLLKLNLLNNALPAVHHLLLLLDSIMIPRDPLYKPPSTPLESSSKTTISRKKSSDILKVK